MSKGVTTAERIESAGVSDGADALGRAEIHDILSNERRLVLLELLVVESPRTLSDLAEEIATAETGTDPPPRNIRQSVYVSLQQTHLPKLADAGFAEYDGTEKVVAITDTAASVLEASAVERAGRDGETESTPLEGYLSLVAIGLVLSLASTAGLRPISGLAASTYAVVTLVTLLVTFTYCIVRDGSAAGTRLRNSL